MKNRELDLIEKNRELYVFISKTEKNANQEVDLILNKYQKYQVTFKSLTFKIIKTGRLYVKISF